MGVRVAIRLVMSEIEGTIISRMNSRNGRYNHAPKRKIDRIMEVMSSFSYCAD